MPVSSELPKIAIILGTSRENGNTRQLISQVEQAMTVNLFSLNDYAISVYDYDHHNINDDFIPLIEKLLEYDHWAFASPVYWYSMSAQMKIFFDRISDLLTVRKDLGRKLRGKSASVISTSETPEAPDCFEVVFSRTADYLGMDYRGMLYANCNDGMQPSDLQPLVEQYANAIHQN